jgi:LysR family transcriptional regulator for bpeEF and oprC
VEVRGNVLASDSETLRHLAIAGAGIARFVDVVVGNAVRDRQLVLVLGDSHHSEPVPLHVVWPQGRHRSPKVSAMVDFLVETFADAPWRAARKAARA